MQPTPKSVHKDTALSNISIQHKNQDFIAERVFRNVPVNHQSGYFFKFLKGAWFRHEAKKRGPGAKAARSGYPVTDDTYRCLESALAHPVPIELFNNADSILQPMRTGARFSTNHVLLDKEIDVSTAITTAANWTSSEDATGGWAYNAGTNTFIVDVLAGKRTVRELIGRNPNIMVIDAVTFDHLKQTSSVLDRIKYTGTQGKPADVTRDTLAQLFELEEVLVGDAIYSDAEEVVAGTDFNAVQLWETNAGRGSAWIGYRPPMPVIEEPSAGYSFNWKGDAGQMDKVIQSVARENNVYRTVRQWWSSSRKSFMVEASEYYDVKVTSADAGFLFYDTYSDG